ncbi:MAG: glutaredoxin [Pseudohongiella sp.]|nr:glutaredoxin [Pseudohongiella sp.]
MTDNNHRSTQSAQQLITASTQPVTLFSLSWCSYCHAAKQLFKQLNVPFCVVELDTGEYREPALNQRLRKELQQMTGSNTLPQVFIGTESIGGYTDTQAALKNGRLKKLLEPFEITLPAGLNR